MDTAILTGSEVGVLSRSEMKNIIAGSSDPEFNDGGDACVKCDQDSAECDHYTSNCSRATVKNACGDDFDELKTVCYPS